MASILIIHHQPHVREVLLDHIRRSNHTPVEAVDFEDACSHAAGVQHAAALVGIRRSDRVGSVVRRIKAAWPTAAVVMIDTALDSVSATEATRHGAYAYLPVSAVSAALGRILSEIVLTGKTAAPARAEAAAQPSSEVIVVDAATRQIFARAERIASAHCTVLITGESGTGKEVLARFIHSRSARRRAKFVPVNCGGLCESLAGSELFGYKKGAFTGAFTSLKGLIEEADGGVLFLDEIGEMPLPIQVLLLRFLDSGEIRPVGDTSVRHVDVRVIAATNAALPSEIGERRFRQDLFFRLNVVSLRLPSLRERPGDIAALVEQSTRRAALKMAVDIPTISDEAMDHLVRYRWPGNVRELQNALEHAVVHSVSGVVTPAELPSTVTCLTTAVTCSSTVPADDRESLVTALQRHHGNHSEAAAALGMSRTTLWRRLRLKASVAPPT